jgi:hypothetical protein
VPDTNGGLTAPPDAGGVFPDPFEMDELEPDDPST